MPVSDAVLGVDACKAGWVGVVLNREEVAAYFATTIGELVSLADAGGRLVVVGIDIPIGLPDAGRRQADLLARKAVGPRWSSVFMTPVRAALQANDHVTAVAANRQLAGEGISRQAFSLKERIFEVDAWARLQTCRVVEIHPEVSFARMAGGPIADGKLTWAGVQRRRELLARAGIRLAGDLGTAGRMARVDDVLDAAAAAWSARRVAAVDAVSLPSPPEMYSDGWPCAIWA
jgi:predicted RNase H-like nuclease